MRTRKYKPHIAYILTLGLVWLILSAGGDGNVKSTGYTISQST